MASISVIQRDTRALLLLFIFFKFLYFFFLIFFFLNFLFILKFDSKEVPMEDYLFSCIITSAIDFRPRPVRVVVPCPWVVECRSLPVSELVLLVFALCRGNVVASPNPSMSRGFQTGDPVIV